MHGVLDGFNACIFAYGQTGAGKTYTMEGTGPQAPATEETLHAGSGVNARAFHQLFAAIGARKARTPGLTFEVRRCTALVCTGRCTSPHAAHVIRDT